MTNIIGLTKVLMDAGICHSKSEVTRLLNGNGLSLQIGKTHVLPINTELLEVLNSKPVVSKYPDNLMDGWLAVTNGSVSTCDDRGVMKKSFDQGNWFATKEEAELEVKRRAVIQKMRAYGFARDLERATAQKRHKVFNGIEDVLRKNFETNDKMKACLDALGDEILEIL